MKTSSFGSETTLLSRPSGVSAAVEETDGRYDAQRDEVNLEADADSRGDGGHNAAGEGGEAQADRAAGGRMHSG